MTSNYQEVTSQVIHFFCMPEAVFHKQISGVRLRHMAISGITRNGFQLTMVADSVAVFTAGVAFRV